MYERDVDESIRHHSYAQLNTEHLSGASFGKYIIHVDLASGKDRFEFVSIPISSIREKQRILSNDAEF